MLKERTIERATHKVVKIVFIETSNLDSINYISRENTSESTGKGFSPLILHLPLNAGISVILMYVFLNVISGN